MVVEWIVVEVGVLVDPCFYCLVLCGLLYIGGVLLYLCEDFVALMFVWCFDEKIVGCYLIEYFVERVV